MNRVERHIVVNKEIDELCFLSKNLYNYANYCIRQSFCKTSKIPNEYELTSKLCKRNQKDYKALPSQVSQQVIKLLYKNWKSFFRSIKDYKKNPKKYLGRPKLPKYKDKDGRNIVIFTNQQCRIKDGYIHFVKNVLSPLKTKVQNEQLQQVRVIPEATCFIIEVVYRKEIIEHENLNYDNFLSIDLGVNNLATCFNNVDNSSFIVNGRPLKSINQYSNKLKAKYMSYVGGKGTSNNIKKVVLKRNNIIQNYLHHVSKYIVQYCINNNIGTVIVGHNNCWKQEVKLGRTRKDQKKNNQNFVSIPFNTLIQQIQYKGEENSINVIVTEESYSSKIDHFAYETMEHHDKYLGKRVHRGLFRTSDNKYINCDVNGAIGIARKVIGDSVIKQITDRGFVSNPIKITTFNKGV